MKVLHLITDLDVGGAEMMLSRVAGVHHSQGMDVEVISMTSEGPIADRIRQQGIPVSSLGMQRGRPSVAALRDLRARLRASSPDLMQSWLYHANLMASLAAVGRSVPLVWGVRQTFLNPAFTTRSSRVAARLVRYVPGPGPSAIVCCSRKGVETHEKIGYPADRMVVIPNGFDVNAYKPLSEARAGIGRELGLPDDARIVGFVGRFNPIKDLRTFFEAAALLDTTEPDLVFVVCGRELTRDNLELVRMTNGVCLRDNVHLLGERLDVAQIMPAFDVLVSSSVTEGFPNAVGEAMACGVPCVVTDVGDSAFLVGDTGRVSPPSKPARLAQEVRTLLRATPEDRHALGARARERVLEVFDISVVADRYLDLYRDLASGDSGPVRSVA
jgi:glycosyltransferase involved in cell wall biosynthesis